MSSDKNLITDSYSQACIQIAKSYTDCVIGYICQERIDQSPGTLHMVPGVRFAKEGDSLGQRYTSPKDAIAKGADIIIVGRGITEASNPLQEAQLYRDAAWKAYENLTNETFCTPL
jgi:orotidine-5'-phosphate decarboxylase